MRDFCGLVLAESWYTVIDGSRGLSCFFVPLRDAAGALNNISIPRLKNKLGTRQLPTGTRIRTEPCRQPAAQPSCSWRARGPGWCRRRAAALVQLPL